MKSTFKAICALLAVVLLFSALPMSAFAAGHVHNYVVTTTESHYEWLNDEEHIKVETHEHACACGNVFYETHYEGDALAHFAAPGSGEYVGTRLGPNGENIQVYEYFCKICNHTFVKNIYT